MFSGKSNYAIKTPVYFASQSNVTAVMRMEICNRPEILHFTTDMLRWEMR
jgi:hypothetical protein